MIFTPKWVLTLALLTSVASAQATKSAKVLTGWVSDTKCGTTINRECSKTCLQQGAHVIVVSDSGQQLIKVVNEEKLKDYEGEHVSITGTLVDGALQVQSVKEIAKTANK